MVDHNYMASVTKNDLNIEGILMSRIKLFLIKAGIAALFSSCLYLSSNNAEASDFVYVSGTEVFSMDYISQPVISAAIGYSYLNGSGDFHGINLSLSVGYRFLRWMSVEVEQDLFGGGSTELTHCSKTGFGQCIEKTDDSAFYGATILNLKIAYPNDDFGDIYLKLGLLGISYSDSIEFEDKRYDRSPDKYDYSGVSYALRVGVGYTYYAADNIGIGANLDYTLNVGSVMTDHMAKVQFNIIYLFDKQ